MPVAEQQQRLVAKYRIIEDPQERLAAIVARGRKWPAPEEGERNAAHRVQGCVSQVWLAGEMRDGCCHFRMAADSPLVQGLAALLCELYEGSAPEDAAAFQPALLEELGLARQLSPTRLHGLANVVRRIREIASGAAAG